MSMQAACPQQDGGRKYLATHSGPASYDPLAYSPTRRTAMYRERGAETSF
jgi:hypothetical protein